VNRAPSPPPRAHFVRAARTQHLPDARPAASSLRV
jgi:hypothetical protein